MRGWEFAGDAPEDGAGIILDDVAGQDAESGKRAGQGWHDHVGDAESLGQGAGVEASGAAESYERVIARIAAAFDGDDADGFLHGGVDDADYAGGKLLDGQRGLLLVQPFGCDAAGALEIESEISSQETRGLQAA